MSLWLFIVRFGGEDAGGYGLLKYPMVGKEACRKQETKENGKKMERMEDWNGNMNL